MDPRVLKGFIQEQEAISSGRITERKYVDLRDQFAIAAMQALIHVQVKTGQVQTCESAYQRVDAMLAARNA